MSNIIASNAPTSATALNYAGAVTPDTLLLYCSTRIRSIDEQVQTQFKKQEQYRAVTSDVNQIQADFVAQSQRTDRADGLTGDGDFCKNEEAKIDNAIKDAPPGSDAYNRLVAMKASLHSTGAGSDNLLSKDEAKDYAEQLGSLSKDLGSSAELDMINLQSLMSQRQTAIQMITNMVSSLGESQKSIAQKIG
jgi:hypothetical protein